MHGEFSSRSREETANDVGASLTVAESEAILEVVQVDAEVTLLFHQRAQRIGIEVV